MTTALNTLVEPAAAPRRSPAAERNAWVRAVLAAAFPSTKFSVRTTSRDHVRVGWVDGPSARQVRDALEASAKKDNRGWLDPTLLREVTREVVAAAYLAARDSHTSYYSERRPGGHDDVPAGVELEPGEFLARWTPEWQTFDATALTEEDRVRARTVLALMIEQPRDPTMHDISRCVARTVFHRGHIVDAVLAD